MIAAFYNQPSLVLIIRILSLNIIINAISRCQYTKLLKAFKYKELSIITILANAIAICTAVILALNDFGVWSLVYMQLSEMFIATLLYIILNRYIPSFRFSLTAFKEQFSFGINLFGATALKTISDNIQSNIVAKVMPLSVTGCFVQAQRIQHVPSLIFMSVLDKVMFPKLSLVKNRDDLAKKFFQTLSWVGLLAISISLYISQVATELISFILTSKWEFAGKILSLLILVVIPDSLRICCRNILKSLGYSRVILNSELFLSVLIIVSICFFASCGIYAMVSMIIFSYLIGTLYIVYVTSKRLNCLFYNILQSYAKYVFILLFPYIICAFVKDALFEYNFFFAVVIISAFYFLVLLFLGYKLVKSTKE